MPMVAGCLVTFLFETYLECCQKFDVFMIYLDNTLCTEKGAS